MVKPELFKICKSFKRGTRIIAQYDSFIAHYRKGDVLTIVRRKKCDVSMNKETSNCPWRWEDLICGGWVVILNHEKEKHRCPIHWANEGDADHFTLEFLPVELPKDNNVNLMELL